MSTQTTQNGLPVEIERKYLIRRPAPEVLAALPEVQATEITQTYLTPGEGFHGSRRVRRRGSAAQGWEYTYTRKTAAGFGQRIELEDVISAEEYAALLTEAAPGQRPIGKTRYVFRYLGQLFELDVYDFSEALATLEIELPAISTPVELPPMLDILRDVTGDDGYSNYALAKDLAFPER